MSRLLLVVVREEPGRYAYFKHTYSSDTVEVIIDRRMSERRRGESRPPGILFRESPHRSPPAPLPEEDSLSGL